MKLQPQIKEPKDLGLKMGTKEEVAWTQIKDKAIMEIEQYNRAIILNQAILDKAKEMIKSEKDKFAALKYK